MPKKKKKPTFGRIGKHAIIGSRPAPKTPAQKAAASKRKTKAQLARFRKKYKKT
jgi:hypothetical protein